MCAPLLAALLSSTAARAQTVTPHEHFERGVALASEGDFRTALHEFRAAYEASQSPEVLFNIAAMHEQLNEYAEAQSAIERYQRLASPDYVARHREQIVAAMQRLATRVGSLRVSATPAEARCTLDGAAVGAEELRAGYRVSIGRRTLRCEAPGHQPREQAVDVSSGAPTVVEVSLSRVPATVAVNVDRVGAEVRVDGQLVGRTPLTEPLRVDEGTHTVSVSHPGYESVERVVQARGDAARVEVALRWLDPVPADVAARLVVRTNERGAAATLDGRSIPTDGSLALPPGAHRLRVERADFLAVERDVTLAPGARASEDIALQPTPSYRDAYASRARRQRLAWQVTGGVGAALAVAGAVVFGLSFPQYLDANSRAEALEAQRLTCVNGSVGTCVPGRAQELAEQREQAYSERDASLPTVIVGGAMLGVGVIGTVVAVILASDADPVDRFERAPTFRVGFAPHGAGLGVAF